MNNIKYIISGFSLFLFLFLQASTAFAEDEPKKNNSVINFDNGFSVPESPAFTALNVTPQKINRPDSPKDLAVDLLQGTDRKGNLQTGIAIDTTPALLLAGKNFTINRYRNNLSYRLASRFQFSVATTKGATDDDKSARLALGFRFTPYDDGDPRLDTVLGSCIDNAFANTFAKSNALKTESPFINGYKVRGLRSDTKKGNQITIEFSKNSEYGKKNEELEFKIIDMFKWPKTGNLVYRLEPIQTQAKKINLTITDKSLKRIIAKNTDSILTLPKGSSGIRRFYTGKESKAHRESETANFNPKTFGEECRKASRARNANKSAWTIGAAPTWISPDGAADNLEWGGGSVWTSYSLGFDGIEMFDIEKGSLFIFHARYNFDEQVANDSAQGSFLTQETLSAGGRIRFAATDTLFINAEGLYNYSEISGQDSDVSTEYSIGVDVKIPQFQGTWLELSLGSTSGKEVQSTDDTFLMGKLKWDFSTTGPTYDNKKWKAQSKK